MHLPEWALRALAAVGGWNLLDKVLPVFKAAYGLLLEKYDAPVWECVKKPHPKVCYTPGVVEDNPQIEIRYSLNEVAQTVGRSTGSVRRSLKRMEKLGKVKELHVGWQRKEKA